MATTPTGENAPSLITEENRAAVCLKVGLVSVLFIETTVCVGLVAWWLILLGFGSTVRWIGIALTLLTITTIGGFTVRWLVRRRFRFGLRTMGTVISLAAFASWWLASYVPKYAQDRRRDRAIAIVAKHHRIGLYRQVFEGDDPLLPFQVNFSGSKITDDELLDLAGHSNVTGINLRGSRITDRAMVCLAQFDKLTSVDVSETRVTPAGIEQLRHVPKLCTLSLDASQLRQLATVDDRALPQVSQLWLDDPRIDDQAISDLRRWKKLTSVVIMQGSVSNSGLVELARISTLTHLHIDSCAGVTDAGLPHLTRLAGLQFLVIRDTSATPAAGAKLQEDLPDCRILVGTRAGPFYEGGPMPAFFGTGNDE